MNLNFIPGKENMYDAAAAGNNILELYRDTHLNRQVLRAYDYNPRSGTIMEISPEIPKYSSVYVKNCLYNPDKFYYASYTEKDEEVVFSLYEYDFAASARTKITDFIKSADFLASSDRLKIFALNSTYFIFQTERIAPENSDSLMGVISFDILLYSRETGEFMSIDIPDLVNNGINDIIPASDSRIIIKCGYSFIEDERFSALSESEALIESIYLTGSAQLTADIILNKSTGSMELIDAAYFDKCITAPDVKDDYVYFEVIDFNEKNVCVNFVNINTLERFKYIKENNPKSKNGLPIVICNTPYIKISGENTEKFLNLQEGFTDMEFFDEKFICARGNLLFFKKIRREKEYLRIYSYPHLKMLYEGRHGFAKACSKDDEYYIYI